MADDTKNRFLRFLETIKNGLNKLRFSFEHQRRSRLERAAVFGADSKKIPSLRQWRYLGLVLSPQEKKIITILLVIAGLSCSVLVGRWYISNRVFVPAEGGKYTEGVVGTPRLINPIYAMASDIDADLASLIYSGLFRVDQNGKVVSDLATTPTKKDNSKTIDITLRDDAVFSSGQPLTANDVVFTYELLKNANYQSPIRSYFLNIDFKAIDARTVEIKLNEPRPDIERALTVGILPQYIWENVPATSATLAEYNLKPIGSGPYMFKSFTKDKDGVIQSYTLTANKTYYSRRAYLDELTFKFYQDYDKVRAALDAHDIDGAAFLPAHLAAPFMNRTAWRAYSLMLPQYVALYFNPLKNDALKEPRLREALFAALDRNKILAETVGNFGVVINGPLSATLFADQKEKISPPSPGHAQQLIIGLGYQLVDGKIVKVTKPKTRKEAAQTAPLTIQITTLDIPEYKKAAQLVADMWSSVGLTVSVNVLDLDNPARKDIVAKRDFEVLLYGSLLGPDLDLIPFWDSKSVGEKGLNLAGLASPEVDTLLEAAASSNSPDIKKQKYAAFQQILERDRIAIFLWAPRYEYFIDARIKGVMVPNLHMPTDRLRGLMDWYYKTRRTFRK